MKELRGMAFVAAMGVASALAAPAQAETTIRFATTLPDSNAVVVRLLQPWADYVNANSNGELTVEIINGGTIANGANVLDRIADGIVDGGWVLPGYTGKPFPHTLVVGLPFVAESATEATAGLNALLDAGLLDDEFSSVAVGALSSTPTNGLHTKDPVTGPESAAGLKLRVADKVGAEIADAIGASGISMPITEAYQALSQGVVDGIVTGWPGIFVFKLQDVVGHHLEVPLGQLPVALLFNKDVWEGLTDEQRSLLQTTVDGANLAQHIGAWYDGSANRFKGMILENDANMLTELDNETRATWENVLAPIAQTWVAETKDGAEVLETFKAGVAGAK